MQAKIDEIALDDYPATKTKNKLRPHTRAHGQNQQEIREKGEES